MLNVLLGMRFILELIPNHTSRRHQWFQESRKGSKGNSRYRDFYIWHQGRKLSNGSYAPPSNWVRENHKLIQILIETHLLDCKFYLSLIRFLV